MCDDARMTVLEPPEQPGRLSRRLQESHSLARAPYDGSAPLLLDPWVLFARSAAKLLKYPDSHMKFGAQRLLPLVPFP